MVERDTTHRPRKDSAAAATFPACRAPPTPLSEDVGVAGLRAGDPTDVVSDLGAHFTAKQVERAGVHEVWVKSLAEGWPRVRGREDRGRSGRDSPGPAVAPRPAPAPGAAVGPAASPKPAPGRRRPGKLETPQLLPLPRPASPPSHRPWSLRPRRHPGLCFCICFQGTRPAQQPWGVRPAGGPHLLAGVATGPTRMVCLFSSSRPRALC